MVANLNSNDIDLGPGEELASYLDRVGLPGRDPAGLTLDELVTAHNRTIPFENLDPLTGTPVVDLSRDALTDKLVRRRRGGYCFEHNTLLGYVLRDLGYDVDFLTGRVEWMSDDEGPTPPRSHEVLAVTAPGSSDRFLVDVGFGGQTLTSPIRLEADLEQQTRHEPYRLRRRGDLWVLESLIRGKWAPLYSFDLAPQQRIDLEVASWYVSTYPSSGFVTGLRVARVADDARINLSNSSLAIHHLSGETERVELDGVDAVLRELDERFGIDVSGIPDVEATLDRVLKAAAEVS